jgi:hypothetical protein
MLSILTDTQQAIIETIRMRLDTKHALEFLKDAGIVISRATYFRQKKNVEKMKLRRLFDIANSMHLCRLSASQMG